MALLIPLGITESGNELNQDLDVIQHLLITGKTGTGKSVLLKSVLQSVDNPSCKIILIDTKGFDFTDFMSTRLVRPVITDATAAIKSLNNLSDTDDNLIIIIDELSDLIATSDDMQQLLIKISKMPNVHLIMATRMAAILSDEFQQNFKNQISFTDGKIGNAIYSQIHIKTQKL